MRGLLEPDRPAPAALGLLGLAAVAVAVAGVEHAWLYHRGYAPVELVGPLFLLNALASAVVVAAFLLERVWLFALGAILISAGSLVAIVISHSSSFFGFSEGSYDGTAKTIVVAEVAAIVLVLSAVAVARLRPSRAAVLVSRVRLGLAALVLAVFVLALLGVGTSGAPKGDPAPAGSDLAASQRRLAHGTPLAREGERVFAGAGCDACHAIAATDADGKLGPRLDTDTDPVKDTMENITEPRKDIAEGYEGNAKLMPADYAQRLSTHEIRAVATFIKTVSGSGR